MRPEAGRAKTKRERRAGRTCPENVFFLLSFVDISFVLSFVLLLSGGLGERETGRPH